MVRTAVVALLLVLSAAHADAQVVRGVVVDAETSVPLNGVFVVLVDSMERARGGVLTDTRGTYVIAASAPGSYRVRAERIGHASTSSGKFELAGGATVTVNLRAAVAPIELVAIDVASENRCIKRPQTGKRTAQLWEEARKALTVAKWTENQRVFQFQSRSYVRDVDARTLSVLNETQSLGISRARPYISISADSLARYGYVRDEGDGAAYYGPDADVLLSESFLDHHCFHTVVGSGDNAGRIGLVFQPVMTVKLPDVRGTLWLDSKTFELQHIDFTYVNVAREYRQRGAGGRTEFKRLSNGAWFVSRWYIRMPIVVGSRMQGYEPVTLQEEGGEVLSVRDRAEERSLSTDGFVRGTVYDSVAGRSLPGASVYLSGTVHRTLADEQGAFALGPIPPGRYTIAFTHPSLDSLPILPKPASVSISTNDTSEVRLAVASVTTIMALTCPMLTAGVRNVSGVVFGHVSDARGNALAGARIRAAGSGLRETRTSGNIYADSRATIQTESDAAGLFIVCGLPRDVEVSVQAIAAGKSGHTRAVRITQPPFTRADFRLQ